MRTIGYMIIEKNNLKTYKGDYIYTNKQVAKQILLKEYNAEDYTLLQVNIHTCGCIDMSDAIERYNVNKPLTDTDREILINNGYSLVYDNNEDEYRTYILLNPKCIFESEVTK